jgi:hypothetical protein
MVSHDLHKMIADRLETALSGICTVLRDEACGGTQHIPLFVGSDKSRATKYCNVDLLIRQGARVCGIIEIEESDIKPTQICGKFLTSALAAFYEHKNGGRLPLCGTSSFFVQVVDSSGLKRARTAKLEQFENLQQSIGLLLPLGASPMTQYRLFEVDGPNDEAGLSRVTEWIDEFLRSVPS